MALPTEQKIQDLRRELLATESRILELQDQITAKQTEQADAIALLGDAELVLENKITYIVELDRSLNQRIRELEEECDRKSEEIENRGAAIQAANDENRKIREERDAIIAELNARIEAANQEVNQAHTIARNLDLKQAELAKSLEATSAELERTVTEIGLTNAKLAGQEKSGQVLAEKLQATEKECEAAQTRITSLDQGVADRDAQLETKTQTIHNLENELSGIKSSLFWRCGKPWRALFGPKS